MIMDMRNQLQHICQIGNLVILQLYLTINTYRQIPNDTVSHLHLAIDTGNEQFVRLLLQHLTIDDKANDRMTFKRCGVKVGMLKVLHEEFNCLYRIKQLWDVALLRSARCNMVDSVQYILDNLPSDYDQKSIGVLQSFLQQCATSGSSNMLQVLSQSTAGAKLLKTYDNFGGLVQRALENGHESFVEHLKAIPLHRTSFQQNEHFTLLTSILKDDLVSFEELIGQWNDHDFESDKKVCQRMSVAMSTLISSPRTIPLTFYNSSLLNMIRAVGKPGSNITEDIVCQFIVNCNHFGHDYGYSEDSDYPAFLYDMLTIAAGFSDDKVMRQLFDRYGEHYDKDSLKMAIQSKYHKTVMFLLQRLDRNVINTVKDSLFSLIADGSYSLDDIKIILDRANELKTDTFICDWAAFHQHDEVFEYVISTFTSDQLDELVLDRIISHAMTSNKLNIVQSLQRRFGWVRGPKLWTLLDMAEHNAYSTLEYHFKSSTFTNIQIIHRLRTIHSILDQAYQLGLSRVIKLCSDYIRALAIPSTTTLPSNHQQMMIICLYNYIRYNAMEWFLKAFSVWNNPQGSQHNIARVGNQS
ncbi:hypothetical protein SAMD00019534_100350 [Acytostelium subglobosum LB1]|uniref:hypothetical protein n=1 Tax=Acytostelium subglobosum LB1 TaxID=1410327 RepID=UPI000644ECF8|nr:hypothetical protein SAMD00019534_100350 [Acytostelium subglobosum LB1]GAM26860.1 hypothetical protein SAMD00019534_100350 [Acytostelium subglobosum LB1]|eukprot:XP_012750128.1 hypothetical protein SAMD00019534_100350 [Acytostelium subglobosum LB1]